MRRSARLQQPYAENVDAHGDKAATDDQVANIDTIDIASSPSSHSHASSRDSWSSDTDESLTDDCYRRPIPQAMLDAKEKPPQSHRPALAPPEQILQARKVSVAGRRVPTWQMQQRDSTFCVECSRPVGTRAIPHVYAEHVRGHPYVCRLCSQGYCETSDMRLHFNRRHADADVAFDDKRDELEQDFLHAYLACYALRPDIGEASVNHKEPVDLKTADSSARKRKPDDAEVADSCPTPKRRVSSELMAADSTAHLGKMHKDPGGIRNSPATIESSTISGESVKPEIYGLDEIRPRNLPSWQMRQRDASFCQLCQMPIEACHGQKHIYRVHLSRQPFACSVCGFTSWKIASVKVHARRTHKDEGAQILDYEAALKEQYEEWHARCFRVRTKFLPDATELNNDSCLAVQEKSPDHMSLSLHTDMSSTADGGDKSTSTKSYRNDVAGEPTMHELDDTVPMMKQTWQMQRRDGSFCQLCNAPTGSDGPTLHIYKVHLRLKPWACSICGQRADAATKLRTHANRVHKGERVQIVDYRKSLQQEFDSLYAQCYRLRDDTPLGLVDKVVQDEQLRPRSEELEQAEVQNISGNKGQPDAMSPCENSGEAPVSYKLDEAVPKVKATWQMLQRDIHFCVLCETPLKSQTAPEHVYVVHLGQKPLVCSICGYRAAKAALIIKHAATHRNEQPRLLDYRPALRQQFEHMHEQCFRARKTRESQSSESALDNSAAIDCSADVSALESPVDGSKAKTTEVVKRNPTWQMRRRDCSHCILCDCPIAAKKVQSHIYEVHMKAASPFRCSVCQRGFARFDAARAHATNLHKNEAASALDNRGDVEAEYEQWHERCFALKKTFQ